MGYFRVILEGHSFSGDLDGQEARFGFYSTVEIEAQTREDLLYAVEKAVGIVIDKIGLRILNRILQKSFCKISKIYPIDCLSSSFENGGATLFNEKFTASIFANFERLALGAFNSSNLIIIKPKT